VFLEVRVMDLPYLRDLRRRAILSQEELATKSGVARDTISKLETGQRRAYPSTIRKLAAGLEVQPQMLLGGVEYLDEEPAENPPEKPKKGKDRKIGF
jgi:transcriptional regulator with XRE-family HTH domain